MEEKIIEIAYGSAHTNRYKPSIFAGVSVYHGKDYDEYHNDIHLLLHQKDFEKKIGVDNLRRFIDTLDAHVASHQPTTQDLSDEDLFKLIEPKSINNLTEAYEYSKYLKEKHEETKARIRAYKAYKDDYAKRQKSFEEFFNSYKSDE